MKTRQARRRGLSRRDVIKTAASVGLAASVGPFFHVNPARAAKTLKILQWNHFVPGYDKWFNTIYVKEWGEKNNTEVIVDNVNLNLISSRAAAEVAVQKGHDLVMFLAPPSIYEGQVVDLADVYAECEKRHGKPVDLAVKSTYNPRTKKYFAFSDSYVPDPINYRMDLWGEIGMKPDSWDEIRTGGKKIKQKTGIPVGIGLSAELDTAMAMRAIMYSFGAHEQDVEGNLAINSKQTLEAIKFVKALFEEAETPEVLAWDPSSNNRQMLAGRSSLVLNAISVTRAGENDKLPIHEKIGLARVRQGPRAPHGPRARDGLLCRVEIRREHRRRQEISRRLRRQFQVRLHWRASSTTFPLSPRPCPTSSNSSPRMRKRCPRTNTR